MQVIRFAITSTILQVCTHLLGLELLEEAGRHKVLHLNVELGGGQGRGRGRALQLQELLDRADLGVVGRVRHRLALGRQPAARHPLGVLVLLLRV